jgi:coenzyme F420-reducing hydrogenase delta subunit/Pyruvate/2-oxoacid:ferredoxin oxidoreductase delta subunit
MEERTNIELREQTSPPPEVIVFGSGTCAQKIASNLYDHGIQAWIASREGTPCDAGLSDKMHWFTGVELTACRGFAKHFKLMLTQEGSLFQQQVPAIVLAEDDDRSPNYASYGLKANPRVLSISSLEEKIHQVSAQGLFDDGARVVFLNGWHDDSHPVIARRMITCCHYLQSRSPASTYFLTGNLKVAANRAETLVKSAKRSGAIFLKFTRDYPTIQMLSEDCFEIAYKDELTHTPFQLRADWIIVDETIGPGRHLCALARGLAIDQDGIGFAQSDNVHRMGNATNRRGIFVAGGSRGIFSVDEQLADADQVTLNVLAFLNDRDAQPRPTVAIDQGLCARCLTCHRLCPHRAIDLGDHMSVVTEACQSCGICVAACPAGAIDMQGVHIGREVYRQIQQPAIDDDAPQATLQVMVFGCVRSAGQARELSRLTGRQLPEEVRFIEVPCGGSLSSRHLLAAFEAGADGVMLFICHTDNCRSEIGNQVARKRAEAARDLLLAAGVESKRLAVASVAANMGSELTFMIDAFVDRIKAIDGP